jgi:hypothetical protein
LAKTILSVSHSNSEPGTTVAGTTEYWLFGYTAFEKNATESTREVIWRSAGTLSKLYVRLTANNTSTNGSITIRKNGAATALAVTVTAGSGAVVLEDTSDTVTVAAGDKLCIQTVSGGTGTFTMTMVSCIWDATTNTTVRYVAKGYGLATASATQFLPIAGDRSGTTTSEPNVENTIKTAGTIKNGSVNVTANARTNNTTFTVRDSRADTAMVITVGSGVTGHREDTSNSLSYAVDDELDWELTTLTGTQTLTAQSFAVDYETTTNNGVLTRGCVGSTADVIFTMASNVTNYYPIGGGNRGAITTESQVQMKAREAFTFKNLIFYTNANSTTGIATVALRVNGANSALTLTIGAGATGFFPDTTHTVTVAAGDLIDFVISNTGTAAGTISVRQLGITTEIAAGQAVERALTTETVSISEAAFTRLAAKTRTRTDTAITIGETRARLAEKMRPLSTQTTTLSESIVRTKGKVKTLSTETITVTGGTIARLLAKIRSPSAPDTTTISETRQRLGSKSRPLSTQTVALSESVQRIKGKIKSLPTETVIVGAGFAARLSSKIRAISLQTVILTDNRTRLKASMRTLVTQTVAIADSIARLVEAPTGITRALSETVALSGTVARLTRVQRLLSENVPKAENVARVRGVAKPLSQTVPITESLFRIKSSIKLLSQTVPTSQSLTRLNTIKRTVIQTVVIAENVARETLGNLVRSLVETVTVSDSITRRTAKLVILVQTIVITEQAKRLSTKLRSLSTQIIILGDSVTNELNVIIKNAIKAISQLIAITDYAKIEVVKKSQRFRKITTPSNWRLKSNHPAWFLGTRGQHDHYEEFS